MFGATGPVKFAQFSTSSSGDTDLVAGVGSGATARKIRVLALNLTSAGITTVFFKTKTTATKISGDHALAANGQLRFDTAHMGHFETVAGEALTINNSAAVQIGGHLVYQEVQ